MQEALLFTEAIEKQQPDYPSWLLEREESVDWMAYSEEEEYWGPVDPAQYLGEDVDVSDFVLIDAAPTHDGAPWQGDGHCNACNVPVRFCTLFGGEVWSGRAARVWGVDRAWVGVRSAHLGPARQGGPLGTGFFCWLRSAPRDHQPPTANRQPPTATKDV